MSEPSILEDVRKALALIAELPPMPVEIRMHPLDWIRLRLATMTGTTVSTRVFGTRVIIDLDVEERHPKVKFSDGTTKTLGADQ